MRYFAVVDDGLVEDTLHLRRTIGEPALKRPDPVVPRAEALGSVLQDPSGLWRMWFMRPFVRDPEKDVVGQDSYEGIAHSNDGIEWEFPELGIVEESGSKANPFIIGPRQQDAYGRYITGYGGISGFCVVDAEVTSHPAARGRFTVMYHSSPTDRIGGICLAHSEDGIHWTTYPENPVIIGSQDTQNCFFYAPRLGRYVCFERPMIYCGVDRHANRKMARLDSEDLIHWSPDHVILDTDERDAPAFDIFDEPGMRGARGRSKQFQGMTPFPYNDAYLGLTWFYDVRAAVFSTEMVRSADTHTWKREALREPLIAKGRPPGFKGNIVVPIASPPNRAGDELYLYLSDTPHGHHEIAVGVYEGTWERRKQLLESTDIYLLSLKRDRWISYDACEQEGEFLSTPIDWEGGGKLFLNLKVAQEGYVKVAFEDKWARPIPECHLDEIPPITGPLDEVDHLLTFGPGPKTVVKFPVPGPIRIRLRMKNASVYGWALEESSR